MMRSRMNGPIHGTGQGWIFLVFVIVFGLLIYFAPMLDFPVEPFFTICGGK